MKSSRDKSIMEKFRIYENNKELANIQFNKKNFEKALTLYTTVN